MGKYRKNYSLKKCSHNFFYSISPVSWFKLSVPLSFGIQIDCSNPNVQDTIKKKTKQKFNLLDLTVHITYKLKTAVYIYSLYFRQYRGAWGRLDPLSRY